jgi:HSP20 family protein
MAEQQIMSKATGNGHGASRGETTRAGQFYRPLCDIFEREGELLVVADVPGAKGSEIEVKFEDGLLTIHAPVEARQSAEQDYVLREYGVGDYYRTFQVSESIDAAKITASCSDGVLTLHLPQLEAMRPRRINVNAE